MKTINIKETLELAIQNHKENNFEIAEKLYKEILNIDPGQERGTKTIILLL